MAMGPICIITPSGMICSSSKPMKSHFPAQGPVGASSVAASVYDAVDHALASIITTPKVREVYATVAQLMAQGQVNLKEAFTITATADQT